MLLAIVFGYLAYKRATDSGRNGTLWAVVAITTFIMSQLVAGFLIGLLFAVGTLAVGWPETLLDDYAFLLNVTGVAVGIGASSLVLWYLGRRPAVEPEVEVDAPPPPPTFSGQ